MKFFKSQFYNVLKLVLMEKYFYESEDDGVLIKPPPDIYDLFAFYNKTFFFNALEACEVKWSKRMTLCAGTCQHSSFNSCTITLSQPLLQYRSNNELKETLIHEMIHGYLFLTNPQACKDYGGHGKEFQHLMAFINEITRLNISIYHSFHDEVEQMRVHIWKCDGNCVEKAPYFGLVKRAMNRAPGPSDNWYEKHQKECGGKFTKIDGPEFKEGAPKKERKKENRVKKEKKENKKPNRKITEFLTKNENYKNHAEEVKKPIENKQDNFKGDEDYLENNKKTKSSIYRFKFLLISSDDQEIEILKILLSDNLPIKAISRVIEAFFIEFSHKELIFIDDVHSYFNEITLSEDIYSQKNLEYSFIYKEAIQFSIRLEFIYEIIPSLNPLVLEAVEYPKVFGIMMENLNFDIPLKLDDKTKINEKLKALSKIIEQDNDDFWI